MFLKVLFFPITMNIWTFDFCAILGVIVRAGSSDLIGSCKCRWRILTTVHFGLQIISAVLGKKWIPIKLSSAALHGSPSQDHLLVDSLLRIYISRIWATAGVTSSELPYQIRRPRAYHDSCCRAAVRREWSFNCLPPHTCLLLWCCICSASYQ